MDNAYIELLYLVVMILNLIIKAVMIKDMYLSGCLTLFPVHQLIRSHFVPVMRGHFSCRSSHQRLLNLMRL